MSLEGEHPYERAVRLRLQRAHEREDAPAALVDLVAYLDRAEAEAGARRLERAKARGAARG